MVCRQADYYYGLEAAACDGFLSLVSLQDNFSDENSVDWAIQEAGIDPPLIEKEIDSRVWIAFSNSAMESEVIIPLWLIAVPLTSLSAILLLWPSRIRQLPPA